MVIDAKLKFTKMKLRHEYLTLLEMKDSVDCGLSILREVSPTYTKQEELVYKLYDECQQLEKQLKIKKDLRNERRVSRSG